jgi:hypothetical protein
VPARRIYDSEIRFAIDGVDVRLDDIGADPAMRTWLMVLLVTDVTSLIIDFSDVVRFVRGERSLQYAWHGKKPF